MKSVLDAGTGGSLADWPRFSAALERAGRSHNALFWVDVEGIIGFVETRSDEQLPGDYDTEVKPYLQSFDSVIRTRSRATTSTAEPSSSTSARN